uniref:E3 ubiquitin-protein ligase ZNRF1 n=1 Tax=Latimeria chalumnae TaxID=7897 RepID=H3AAU4_LATCH
LSGFLCPFCDRLIQEREAEVHLLKCFPGPQLSYNTDLLSRDSEECSICLEELVKGSLIARLPCLCIYHKSCIDSWCEVKPCCPQHP